MIDEAKFTIISQALRSLVSEEDVKFSIDKSLVKTFGVLTASKINYKISKDGRCFVLQCKSEYLPLLTTATIMMYDEENKYRIKFV